MKPLRSLLCLACLTLCVACVNRPANSLPQQFTYHADVTDAFDTARLALIDSAFTRYVDNGLMPNAVVMIIHRGRVVHHKAYGWRDREAGIACDTSDIFRIASQTKAIAVVAFMTLVEEGRVQIDEPVSRYLPEFAEPRVLTSYDSTSGHYTTRPATREITIRHLLTHTSGLCYKGIYGNIASSLGIAPLNSLDSLTLAQNVSRMGSMPLAHDPGDQFTYSMNIDVLGRLCEVISQQPIDSFISERVLHPLGMNDTHFYLPDTCTHRLVTLYNYPEGGPLQRSTHPIYQDYPISGARMLMSTGAGLSGTASDYARFCQMILNGGTFNNHRIIGRKTLEMMQQNGVANLRGDIGFGMAWDVFTPENAHNTIISTGSMRWGGMFGTDYVIDPTEQLILLMYTNMETNHTGLSPKTLLHNTAYQALR